MSYRAQRRGPSVVASAAHIDLNALSIFSSSHTDMLPKVVRASAMPLKRTSGNPIFPMKLFSILSTG
jgi:hypothetical protein